MLTLQELKKLSEKELTAEFAKFSSKLFKTKFEVGTGASKANHEIKNLRRYRAQIKTVQKNLHLEESANFQAQKEVKEEEVK